MIGIHDAIQHDAFMSNPLAGTILARESQFCTSSLISGVLESATEGHLKSIHALNRTVRGIKIFEGCDFSEMPLTDTGRALPDSLPRFQLNVEL